METHAQGKWKERGRSTHQVLMESHVRWRFSKLHYRDWMDLLFRANEENISVLWYSTMKSQPQTYVRLGVWLLYPAYLTQDLSHYLVVICVLLILYLKKHLPRPKYIPKGLKTPLWHTHRHLQSLLLSVKQYLFMCVTEQQATTNQCSAAIQQCAWFVHFAMEGSILGILYLFMMMSMSHKLYYKVY